MAMTTAMNPTGRAAQDGTFVLKSQSGQYVDVSGGLTWAYAYARPFSFSQVRAYLAQPDLDVDATRLRVLLLDRSGNIIMEVDRPS